MQRFIRINGFVWRYLIILNFWWMFYAAIKSRIAGKSYMIGSFKHMSFIEIGASEPNQKLWDAGFSVANAGYILGKRILHYDKKSPCGAKYLPL